MQNTLALFCHAPQDLRVEETALEVMGDEEILVKIERGGICGSDLHYYHHGGFGAIKIQHPMILGHEIAGRIEAFGKNVKGFTKGQVIAVNPSRACNACSYCLNGKQQHCVEMKFYGSAMRVPHIHGGFREHLVIEARQATPVGEASSEMAAFCEPLAVCLHALSQARSLFGKDVLITGCGPIGALTLLAAQHAGAASITVLDITASALKIASSLGATRAINSLENAAMLEDFKANKGAFDVLFECSGNQAALHLALDLIKPQGVMVQLGLGGDFTFPINKLVAKEMTWKGTFRFHHEFAQAAALVAGHKLNLKPLLSAVLPLSEAKQAFNLASNRAQAMKVQLQF